MPYDGSGGFVGVAAPNWPAVAGQPIYATQFNTVVQDILNGLSNAVTKDGQTQPTQNLPMNGKKHTGAGDATAAGQYLVYGQAAPLKLPNSANAGADVLDYYLEGTWTPEFTGFGGAIGSPTYSGQVGKYTRIGRLVYAEVGLTWSGKTPGPTSITLPIAMANGSSPLVSVTASYASPITLTHPILVGVYWTSGTLMLQTWSSAGGTDNASIPAAGNLFFSVLYHV